MKIGKKSKKLAGDFIYTLMATAVMNIVLQIIIYPLSTRFFGQTITGEILYFIGIIYIFPQAVGTSINSTRLLVRKTTEANNGDYNGILLFLSVLSSAICGIFAIEDGKGIGFIIAYFILAFIYGIRIYSQVEYRLKLNFSGYFFYYLLISVGYLVGFGLFSLTGQWLLIFYCGEALAIIYTIVRLEILKTEKRICARGFIYKNTLLVLISTLIRDGVNQFDKVILKQILGKDVVTQYTAVSMIAKVVQMLVGPVNTIILSYLTVKDSKMTAEKYRKYVIYGLGAGGVVYIGSLIGTPLFLKIFYSQLYDDVIAYYPLVNLGLICSFVASLYMAVLLSQGKSTIYTIIQAVWGFSYVVIGYILTINYSLWGMTYTMLIVNIPKVVVAIIVTYVVIRKEE